MGSDPKPTRSQGDLAEMLELLLDKGVVVNADIAVSVGDTELLGVEIRAAIASFETAAKYGLEFPAGTDMSKLPKEADNKQTGKISSVASQDSSESNSGTVEHIPDHLNTSE
ncbi:MAG: gas vesicle protein [Haloquadratum sp. J07HQX50]|jgi:Gas vesicle protein.|nr:MAG: gas vesicle protein [Haloquadratum sp. J07HQX50]